MGVITPTLGAYVPLGPLASGDATGATDTAAIQALAPGYYRMQPKTYYVTNLAIPAGVVLDFGSWWWLRDGLTGYNAAGWATTSNYGGGVIKVVATSGSGVGIIPTQTQVGGLRNVLIIGPGSGTTIGLDLGSASQALVESQFSNIGIGNFATGLRCQNVEDSELNIKVLGCSAGVSLLTTTNNNRFPLLDIQKCSGVPLAVDSSCLSLTFDALVLQSNTGGASTLNGANHVLLSPYLENNTTGLTVSGSHITVLTPTQAASGDTITDTGTGNFYVGISRSRFTASGTGTTAIDTSGSAWASYAPTISGTGWAVGNGTLTGAYSQIGKTVTFTISFAMGSTSTAGTGGLAFSLPVTLANATSLPMGQCIDQGNNNFLVFGQYLLGSNTVQPLATGGASGAAGGPLTSTVPFPWTPADGDTVFISGTYEAQ